MEQMEQIGIPGFFVRTGPGLGPGQNPRNGRRVRLRPPYIRTTWPRVVLTSGLGMSANASKCQHVKLTSKKVQSRQLKMICLHMIFPDEPYKT